VNTAAMPGQRRSRLVLILIALLFAAPVISAWVAWQLAVTGGVGSTTNAGVLVQPARPLTMVPLRDTAGEPLSGDLLGGRWSYVLLAGEGCDKACLESLFVTRQVRISVNKDMQRVRRVLLLRQAPAKLAELRAAHPDLVIALADEPAWRTLADQFTASGAAAFYLVDPLGNLMMRYPATVPPKGVLMDLRRLLKASQLG